MPSWILALLKYVPGISTVLDKITGASAKADEIRAQVELEEARAFRQGRYAPKYVLKYTLIGIFAVCCMCIMFGMFFPGVVDLEHPIDSIGRLGKALFSMGWD